MSTKIIYSIDDFIEKLFSFFIDEERNKNIELNFEPYLNEYSNSKEKNNSLSGERRNNEEEVANE